MSTQIQLYHSVLWDITFQANARDASTELRQYELRFTMYVANFLQDAAFLQNKLLMVASACQSCLNHACIRMHTHARTHARQSCMRTTGSCTVLLQQSMRQIRLWRAGIVQTSVPRNSTMSLQASLAMPMHKWCATSGRLIH